MIHLNVHSCYSFLSSTIRIDSYLERLVKKHEDSAVLTDINNMCGVMEFIKKCEKSNLKPIIGMEVSVFKYDAEYKVMPAFEYWETELHPVSKEAYSK